MNFVWVLGIETIDDIIGEGDGRKNQTENSY